MVGRRRVGDVGNVRPRHVARDAILAIPSGLPFGRRQGAAPLLVASHATLAIVKGLGRRRRQPVRVVARNAAKLALALSKTAAQFHLLVMPDGLEPALLALLGEKDGPEPVQRQARPKVERLTPGPQEPERALKVALLAD